MEETSWEHFMLTGKVEDYLKFKREENKIISQNELKGCQRNKEKEREQLRAGFSEGDGNSSSQYTGRRV